MRARFYIKLVTTVAANLSKKSFADTEKGKESLKAWFPNLADKIIK